MSDLIARAIAKSLIPETSLAVTKTGLVVEILSTIGNDQAIKLTGNLGDITSLAANARFGFTGAYLDDTNIHGVGDDIAPLRISGVGTVGAAHGYTAGSFTVTANGQTAADVGSIWTDGVNNYTLVKVSGTTLSFLTGYNDAGGGRITPKTVYPVATLAHVSGATHTSDISIVGMATNQNLYPSCNNFVQTLYADGKEITNSGIYPCNEFIIQESYNIMSRKDIIDYLQAHVGSSLIDNDIDGCLKLSIEYRFTKGCNLVITHGVEALEPIILDDCGFIQSVQVSANGGTVYCCVPGVASISEIDFSTLVNMTSYSSNTVIVPANLLDANVPASRSISLAKDGSGNYMYGFCMGYIPDKAVTKDATRKSITTLWNIATTKKSYPTGLISDTLAIGDYRSVLTFRYYIPSISAGTNVGIIDCGQDAYVFIDYHAVAKGAKYQIDSKYWGRTVTVVNSRNFTLVTDAVDMNGIVFDTTDVVAYAVLKLT